MTIVVLDAQGGGIGRMLIGELKRAVPQAHLIAVGTNASATAAMLKAGADQAATGENAVRVCVNKADLILAPLGMVLCDAMLGEVTSAIACAIGSAQAHKILIPVARCGAAIAGLPDISVGDAVMKAVEAASAYFLQNAGAQ